MLHCDLKYLKNPEYIINTKTISRYSFIIFKFIFICKCKKEEGRKKGREKSYFL